MHTLSQSKFIPAAIIGVVVILTAVSFFSKPLQPEPASGPAHHDHASHKHDGIALEGPVESLPDVELIAHEDPKTGWNLQIVTKNFQFSPQRASTAHVDGEGHAHLYINGEKITRLYGEWYYLESLPPGENEVRVNLNANDHSPFLYGEVEIADSVTIVGSS